MKLLANENFPMASCKYLKNKGFDIVAIGVDHPGITDRQVLSIAIKENRTILTFDRDYGELIFKYNLKPFKGIIYLRLVEFTPEEPGHIIEELFNLKEFLPDSKLTVVDRKGIRQRVY
ncbi:MAG: DUF5615 family PIN-like protein [Bacteroidetes bacterium]|nr:DUF5615 family PIN-like protein [Bacteroidota bacterium]